MYLTLTPAYGRDYKSKKAVLEDWDADKDFKINTFGHPYDGSPINKSQFIKDDLRGTIRYDKNRKVFTI